MHYALNLYLVGDAHAEVVRIAHYSALRRAAVEPRRGTLKLHTAFAVVDGVPRLGWQEEAAQTAQMIYSYIW